MKAFVPLLMLICGAGIVYSIYARMMIWQNRNPGAGMFAEFTGDLTERGKRYQRRCYIAAVLAALAAMGAAAISP